MKIWRSRIDFGIIELVMIVAILGTVGTFARYLFHSHTKQCPPGMSPWCGYLSECICVVLPTEPER